MNERNVYDHDLDLFNKIKEDAIKENWVYDLDTFKQDVQRFHDKIREAWQIHDLIETRININTKSGSLGDINQGFGTKWHPFWSWEHIKGDIVKAYYATKRYPL